MPKSKLKIKQEDNLYIIEKNDNYELFFSLSVVFYQKIIEIMQKSEGMLINLNPKFESLLLKLNIDNQTIKLTQEEFKLLIDWIDSLCLIMLDIESIDFKDKGIKKYLQICESLIETSKKILPPIIKYE